MQKRIVASGAPLLLLLPSCGRYYVSSLCYSAPPSWSPTSGPRRTSLPPLEGGGKTCRVCKETFYSGEEEECRYHSGRWMGAERAKHYGVRSGGVLVGLEMFWDCCDAPEPTSPGCCTGRHISYDEE